MLVVTPVIRLAQLGDAERIGAIQVRAWQAAYRGVMPDTYLDELDVDDVERPGEQEVLRRWERETGLDFHRRAEDAGIAVARTTDSPLTGPHHGWPPTRACGRPERDGSSRRFVAVSGLLGGSARRPAMLDAERSTRTRRIRGGAASNGRS